MTVLEYHEPGGWTRLGKRPGPVMRALGFMRIERTSRGWRAWGVLRVSLVRPMYATTTHKTLRAAKQHCQQIVNGDDHGN